MPSKKTASGFAHLGILFLVVILIAVGLVGYRVMKKSADKNTVTTPAVSQTTTPQAPTIKKTSDLDKAQSALNSQSVDSDVNPSTFNSDVSNLY